MVPATCATIFTPHQGGADRKDGAAAGGGGDGGGADSDSTTDSDEDEDGGGGFALGASANRRSAATFVARSGNSGSSRRSQRGERGAGSGVGRTVTTFLASAVTSRPSKLLVLPRCG